MLYKGSFVFESAWQPPDDFQDHLLITLAKIDPSVIVINEYNVEDGTYGSRYIAMNTDGEINADAQQEVNGSALTWDEENDDDTKENHTLKVKYHQEKLKNILELASTSKQIESYLDGEIKNLKKYINKIKKRKL